MKRIVGMVLSFTVTALVAGFFSRFDVDPHHDGIFLKPAVDMVNGQFLFKDSFSIYGPGASVFHYLVLSLFGSSLIVLKLATALVYGLTAAVLFYISSVILPFAVACVVMLLWIFMAPYYEPNVTFFIWPSIYALFFQLSAAACCIAWLKKGGPVLLALSGFCVAATVWIRLPVGGLLYLAFVVYLIVDRKIQNKKTFIFHISFLIFNACAILMLWTYKVISEWFFQSVVFVSWWHSAVLGGRIFGIVFLEKMLPLSYGPISVWVLLPASAVYVIWKKIKNPEIILLAFVGLASWVQYYPMNDIHHIYWAATPFFPLLVWTFYTHPQKARHTVIALGVLCILFIPDIYNRARMVRHKLKGEYIKIQSPAILRGMLVRKTNFDEIQKQYTTIRRFTTVHPDGMVVSTGPDVLYTTFATNTKNCHPFTSNWGWEVYNKSFHEDYFVQIRKCKQVKGNNLLLISKTVPTCSCSN